MTDRATLLEREAKWAKFVGIAAILSVLLIILAGYIARDATASHQAEALTAAHAHKSALIVSSILQGISFLFWIPALIYLFRAVQGRSTVIRANLIGVTAIAPVFLAASYVVAGFGTIAASNDFVSQMVTGSASHMDDIAQKAIDGTSLQGITLGLGFGGRIGLAFVLIYLGFYAMRTGLLTRFWGSLGMAVGLLFFVTPLLTIVWFAYFGLLVAGWLPGGRPPAWAAGRAIAWPTPGEKVASDLDPRDRPGPEDVEGEATPVPPEEPKTPPRQRGERRKRKSRD